MTTASVLIITFNEQKNLARVLRKLSVQSFRDIEIIVCDNASSDGTKEMLSTRFKKVKHLISKQNIGTAVLNLGVKEARGRYILPILTDMFPSRHYILNLLKAIENDKQIGFCMARWLDTASKSRVNGCHFSRSFYSFDLMTNEMGESPKEIPMAAIGIFRSEALKKCGGLFDPDFFLYNEDMDLGLRLRLAGYTSLWIPSTVAYYEVRSKSAQLWKQPRLTFLSERNALITYFKICSFSNLIFFFPYVFGMRLASILKDIALLRLGSAWARISAILWFFSHPTTLIRKRIATQKLRKMPDSFVFKLADEKAFLKRTLFG